MSGYWMGDLMFDNDDLWEWDQDLLVPTSERSTT